MEEENKHPGLLVLIAVTRGPFGGRYYNNHQEWISYAVQAYARELRFFGRNAARSVVGYLADDWPLENYERRVVIDFIEEEVAKRD